MKIVHLSTRDSIAGAFRGTYTLHQGLRQAGIDSQLLVARKYTQDPTVHLPTATLPSRVLHALRMWREIRALDAYPNRHKGLFTPAAVSANLHPALRRLNPDIIHLHWIAHGFVRPEDLPTWKRPLVWTLRDMWVLTGGCHITDGCERFLAQCGLCPQLSSNSEEDSSRKLWQRKRAIFRTLPLHFIALSTWLGDCLRASPLSEGHSIHVIPNAIDSVTFTPKPKAEARAQLGLPSDTRILLFGALAVDDGNKGFNYLKEAIHLLASQPQQPPLHLVTFGMGKIAELDALPIATTHVGYIGDNAKLAALYSAADVMVVPSIFESFGKTAAEALSCATPVVCFDVSGLKDIVEHKQSGYRAEPFSSEDLAAGITWVLADEQRHAALSQRGRTKVTSDFSLNRVAEQHRALYAQILHEQPNPSVGIQG